MSLNVENLAKQGKITAESVLGGVTEDDNDNVSMAAGSEISEGFCSVCLERKGLFEMAGKSRCKSCDSLRIRIRRVDPCAADGSSCLDKFNNILNLNSSMSMARKTHPEATSALNFFKQLIMVSLLGRLLRHQQGLKSLHRSTGLQEAVAPKARPRPCLGRLRETRPGLAHLRRPRLSLRHLLGPGSANATPSSSVRLPPSFTNSMNADGPSAQPYVS